MLASLLVLPLQIQSHARRQVCLKEVWGELQGTIIKRQGFILLALAIQLLALFDKLEGIVRFCGRLCAWGTRLRLCAEKGRPKQQCRQGAMEKEGSESHRRAIIAHCASGEEWTNCAANSGYRRFLGAEPYPNKPATAGPLSGPPVRPSE